MDAVIGLVCGLGSTILLLALGLLWGGANERRHLRRLFEREAMMQDMYITQVKSYPAAVPHQLPPQMLNSEVIIASDYLKTFFAGLRNLFGGEVRGFETLLVRARREATLRMLEQAKQMGYNAICNVRLETADVGGNAQRRGLAMAAILASSTAYNVEAKPTRMAAEYDES